MNSLDRIRQYPVTIEITISGLLSEDWQDWLGGLAMSQSGNTTTLVGEVLDQPALYGLILKLRDLGLSLVSLQVIR